MCEPLTNSRDDVVSGFAKRFRLLLVTRNFETPSIGWPVVGTDPTKRNAVAIAASQQQTCERKRQRDGTRRGCQRARTRRNKKDQRNRRARRLQAPEAQPHNRPKTLARLGIGRMS